MDAIKSFVKSEDDKVVFTHRQKVNDIYLLNQEDRKNSDEKWNGGDKDMKHVARIPMIEYIKMQQAGLTGDAATLLKAIELRPELKATTKTLI